jgi:DNA-binding CsgD family transcriptional regulator
VSPPRRASQHLDTTVTVPINWQITWQTNTSPLSPEEAESPDRHQTAQGGISAPLTFETTKLAHLIANAASANGSDPSAGCMLIARDEGRTPYVVRVAPVSTTAGYNLPAAMILVANPDENLISQRELAELYGLSPAESRLALALARGKRLTSLVAEFGVQVTTLRTQLSSVLRKCEVERQADLIRLIGSIPVVQLVPHDTEHMQRAEPSRAAF